MKAIAVGVAVRVSRDPALAGRIESAMAQAVRDAMAEGVPLSDADEIRRRMRAAREFTLEADRRAAPAPASADGGNV